MGKHYLSIYFHMAKRRPTPTLAEMEKKLGYRVDSLNYPEDGVQRFYSDPRPVLTSPYERTKKDFEELKNQKEYEITSETILPDRGVPQKNRSWPGHSYIHT